MSVKILLADDHCLVREGLRRLLDEQGGEFTVVGQTGDGRRAVELAAALSPDVAVIDVTMPGLNGIDAARQIKWQSQRVRVIMLSMHAERQFIEEALAAGAHGYMLKDGGLKELLFAVRAVMQGGIYLSPKVQASLVRSYFSGDAAAATTPRSAAGLTPCQREVLQLVAEGKSAEEIAHLLHRNVKTVEGHRREIMSKLHIDNVADLTRYAIREGLVPLV